MANVIAWPGTATNSSSSWIGSTPSVTYGTSSSSFGFYDMFCKACQGKFQRELLDIWLSPFIMVFSRDMFRKIFLCPECYSELAPFNQKKHTATKWFTPVPTPNWNVNHNKWTPRITWTTR